MSLTTLPRRCSSAPATCMEPFRIVAAESPAGFTLADGSSARPAVSCLVQPQVGDRVLVLRAPESDQFILHVLERQEASHVWLQVPGANAVTFAQRALHLVAQETLSLRSAREVELTALGNVSLSAQNLFTTIQSCLVQNVEHWVAKARTCNVQARELLRLHARHGILTAEAEMKVDAERITVG